jgi:predicted O-linked N-acetylglucosamine transferase (SPINDLY family)
MDYLVADVYQVPRGVERHYREAVLRMPDGYVCFEPPAEAPAVGPLPALERGHLTFGCFNNVAKLSRTIIARWVEILQRVPGSKLLLMSPGLSSAVARHAVTSTFVHAGGPADRLELRGGVPRDELLAAYGRVDVALDSFPYSGGVTTCEALWMGVPVITCPGETFASRHSLSHLTNAGLTETVADSLDAYVDRAVQLAGDPGRLSALRSGLRHQMAGSPLCDGPRFARHLMTTLRAAWTQWCRRVP